VFRSVFMISLWFTLYGADLFIWKRSGIDYKAVLGVSVHHTYRMSYIPFYILSVLNLLELCGRIRHSGFCKLRIRGVLLLSALYLNDHRDARRRWRYECPEARLACASCSVACAIISLSMGSFRVSMLWTGKCVVQVFT
jgi:hypothetical protein